MAWGTVRGTIMCEELSTLWEKTNMHTRKWLSHSAKFLEKISAKMWSWIYQMNFMQLKSIYQKISTISKNTWIMLKCKGRSIHIPQCVNWSTLSIHQPEFIKKYFVTFESIWFTRVKMLIKDVWVSKIDWDEELNKECKDAAVKSF